MMPAATIASTSAIVHDRRGMPSAACVVAGMSRKSVVCSFM
jgi:hypothetical protein